MRCDFLLSWVFLGSLAALLVNDLYLKPYRPSVVSGILSDFAGIVFFPILLVALAEVMMIFLPGKRFAAPWWFALATIFVALSFVVVKFTNWGETAYVSMVNPVVEWTGSVLSLGTTGVVSDPWDLLALALLPVPYLVGRKWRGNPDAAHLQGQTASD
jgi:hypothetical protein